MDGREADKIVAQWEALSEAEYAKLSERRDFNGLATEYVRAKCLTDLWTFVEVGLKWDTRHYFYELHGALAHFLTDWTMEQHGVRIPVFTKLVQVAREHCKTWWGVASDLQEMARDTSTSILLRSFKDTKAFEIVAMEKAQITKNKDFQFWFPWVKPATENNRLVEWAKDRFKIESCIVGQRESTVEAYGLESESTGSHFSRRRYDDIATAKIENSEIERQKMLDTVKHDSNLGQAGTRVLFMGTPYNIRGLFYHFEKGDFSTVVYDHFKEPGEFRAFEAPFKCEKPHLGADRLTLKVHDVRLPDHSHWRKNLQYCQARMTFYNHAIRDTVTVIREVEWNDGDTVVLNRVVPELFEQPLSVSIGPNKPSAPNRFTLDEIHLDAKDENSIPRNSLVVKRSELGAGNYSSQILLEPVDSEALVLKESDIKYIDERDLPTEHITYFRTTDFAGPKKKGSRTAFITGLWHRPPNATPMLWVRHIKFGFLKPTDILLELFRGILRVEGWRGVLSETIMEEEARKQTIEQMVKSAQVDPYNFFKAMGDEYANIAEIEFSGKSAIMVRYKSVTRGRGRKEDRIAAQLQPAFQAGMIGFVRGIEHIDDVLEEVNTFTLEGDGAPHLDLLDCLADQVQYGPSRRINQQTATNTIGLWERAQREAQRNTILSRHQPLVWR